jgi:hypothetical protein
MVPVRLADGNSLEAGGLRQRRLIDEAAADVVLERPHQLQRFDDRAATVPPDVEQAATGDVDAAFQLPNFQ